MHYYRGYPPGDQRLFFFGLPLVGGFLGGLAGGFFGSAAARPRPYLPYPPYPPYPPYSPYGYGYGYGYGRPW